MAKFCITNIEDSFLKTKVLYQEAGFEISYENAGAGFKALAAKKMFQSLANNYAEAGSDFVIATGSLIYNESLGYSYFLHTEVDVANARANSIGHYAVSVKKNNVITVWGDSVATYDIFYYNKDGEYMVSNSLYDMAKALGERLSVNEINVLEEVYQCSILGGGTFYNEISRLHGEEYLSISISENTLSVIPVTVEYPYIADKDYDNAVRDFANSLKKRASVIYKIFGTPTICMTAGLDARISLAAYMSCGARPILTYGVGNSALTNTKMDDLYIDRQFKDELGLQLVEGDWTTPILIDKYWNHYTNKYGFFSRAYAASNKVMDFLENSKGNVLTFGYGGELYRNLPWIENNKKGYFTVDEYLNKHYYNTSFRKKLVESVPGYHEQIKNSTLKLCKKYHLDSNHIANRDNVLLQLEYRKFADVIMMNFVNQMKYSFLLLFEYDSVKFARISVEKMNKSRFMLDVIMQLYPRVLDIPVFSHCKKRIFDKTNMELNYTTQDTYKSFISSFTPAFIKTIYRNLFSHKKKDKDSAMANIIYRFVLQHKDEIPYFTNNKIKEDERDLIKHIFTKQILDKSLQS